MARSRTGVPSRSDLTPVARRRGRVRRIFGTYRSLTTRRTYPANWKPETVRRHETVRRQNALWDGCFGCLGCLASGAAVVVGAVLLGAIVLGAAI